jgi:hypothetical protein
MLYDSFFPNCMLSFLFLPRLFPFYPFWLHPSHHAGVKARASSASGFFPFFPSGLPGKWAQCHGRHCEPLAKNESNSASYAAPLTHCSSEVFGPRQQPASRRKALPGPGRVEGHLPPFLSNLPRVALFQRRSTNRAVQPVGSASWRC